MWFINKNLNKHQKQAIISARHLVSCAGKVVNYRFHLIPVDIVNDIKRRISELTDCLKSYNLTDLDTKMHSLNELLKKYGGDIFPVKTINEYVETFFVAALLAISIRSFFIQSFQIPTNSMYPTYHGLTYALLSVENENNNFAKKFFHKVWNIGREIKVNACCDGEISIPLVEMRFEKTGKIQSIMPYEIVKVPKFWGLKQAVLRKYSIFVGKNKQNIFTPKDFSLDQVFLEKFCDSAKTWPNNIQDKSMIYLSEVQIFHTGVFVRTGEPVVHFEILPGDMLFVDKLSYHFREPKLGESIVFNTEKIVNFSEAPKFFIKRLVGKPEDRVKIVDNQLFINDELLQANATLIALNRKKSVYMADGMLSDRHTVSIPQEQFFVLGDNSSNSYDSRYWGFVPKKSVCGKPLLIFCPFSRFGKCK